MQRTFSSRRRASRAGFTLLEMLIVIAVVALVAAAIFPNMRRLMSWSAVRTTLFDFQRQMSGLRSQAYHQDRELLLVSSGEFVDDPEADPSPVEITFNDPQWRYVLSEPMLIGSSGTCAAVSVDIYQGGDLAARLENAADCRLTQVGP